MKITWRSVRGDQGNAVLGGGALSTGLENEILVGASETGEPIKNGEWFIIGIVREVNVKVH
jgi:hypothetical protein